LSDEGTVILHKFLLVLPAYKFGEQFFNDNK